jgi:signal transduction histidine kinase
MRRTIGPCRTTDVLLAGGFAVAATVEAAVRSSGDAGSLAVGLGGAAAMAVLLVRRDHPAAAMTAFCVSGAGATWVQARMLDSPDPAFVPILTLIVLSFALGAHGTPRDLGLGAAQPIALVALVDLLEPDQGSVVAALVFVTLFVVVLPVVAGRLVRSRRRMVAELRSLERAAALEHRRRLRVVDAEESLSVTTMLHQTLETELEGLLAADDIEDVERRARELLTTTRDTVVGLARDHASDDVPEAVSAPTGHAKRLPTYSGTEAPAATWTLVVAAAIGAGLTTETSADWPHPVAALALTALVLGGIVAIIRRPLAGVLLSWVAATLYSRTEVDLGGTFSGIGLTVALPFLATWLGDRRRGILAILAGLAGAVAGLGMDDPFGATVLTALAAVAGSILHDRTALLTELRAARADAVERRGDELRVAALERRAALGRELHDSIGHALTVVALQAGAARRLRETDPAAAAGARDAIDRTARQALKDLRRGFETAPSAIFELVDTVRDAGLEVEVAGPSPPVELAPAVYRVVQEALTNVLRHAPGTQVEIRLGGGAGSTAYTCTVRNSEPVSHVPVAPAYPSASRGLSGMRARVEELGGTVEAGPVTGGFEVTAGFPSAEAMR